MSQNNIITDVTVDEYDDNDEYSADDFGFIIDAEGELKSVMIPEHLMEDPPEEVIMILKLFGIEDINMLESRTLH
jgi:hypothetical protein